MYWWGKLNYNDNDKHEKVTIKKNNYFLTYKGFIVSIL